jgi:hypothetical protein
MHGPADKGCSEERVPTEVLKVPPLIEARPTRDGLLGSSVTAIPEKHV